MNFLRSLFNLILIAIGGVLGNLLAGWVQQDVWGSFFTPSRLILTLVGLAATLLLLAGLDARGGDAGSPPPVGLNRNRQIGARNLIRVLAGTNAFGNWQIGAGNRIEVIDASLPPPARGPASAGGDPRAALQEQRAAKKELLAILEGQLANFPPGSAPAEKLLQAQKVRDDIRRIEDELDSLPPE